MFFLLLQRLREGGSDSGSIPDSLRSGRSSSRAGAPRPRTWRERVDRSPASSPSQQHFK